MTETLCPKCNRSLPSDRFNKHKRQCNDCRAAVQRAYVERNRMTVYERNKAWRDAGGTRASTVGAYGLTVTEYESLLAAQGGLCGICKETCPSGRNLAVDHDHETGKVRGLLCTRCNPGLGYFRDDAERLRAALQWITTGGTAPTVLHVAAI